METTHHGKNISHEPIIPLFLYLHERRPTVVHKEGWNSMKTVLENNLKEDMVLFNDHPKVLELIENSHLWIGQTAPPFTAGITFVTTLREN
jgi:hypothetical protein